MSIERVAVAVDVVCFRLAPRALEVLLVQRQVPPFADWWALPGGVVGERERLDAAAKRILQARSGLQAPFLEQLYTFDDPDRDPRGRTLAVAYYALLPADAEQPTPVPGQGVATVQWTSVDDLPALAFDHAAIVAYARQRLAQKIVYTPAIFYLLPARFTLTELRHAHEAIEGRAYTHLSNFQTLMRARWDLVRVPGDFARQSKRPAQRYRYAGPLTIVGPPA